MVKNSQCLLCKGKKIKRVCEDGGYIYCKCMDCSLMFLANIPNKSFFRKFYSYSDAHGFNQKLKVANPLLSLFLNKQFLLGLVKSWGNMVSKNWENSVVSVKGMGRVLDVGCGPAILLGRLQKLGWDVYGIEVGDKLVGQASEEIGKERVFKGELPKIVKKLPGKFDVVSFWHVLEHIDDFEKYIKTARMLLKKDGVLLVEVPHERSINFSLYDKYWTLLMSPQHLHFWNEKTLSKLVEKNNMKITSIHYPAYFYFVFSSSFIKKYPNLFILTPLLMGASLIASVVFSAIGRGDVIRIYAVKK